jgi:hypothetical protein
MKVFTIFSLPGTGTGAVMVSPDPEFGRPAGEGFPA